MSVTGYDVRLRPAQPATPAADAFTIHRSDIGNGLELAYVREGVGGYPLLLIHGYPETKRICASKIQHKILRLEHITKTNPLLAFAHISANRCRKR